MSYNFIAVVPMRHSSERIEGKNYRDFCGQPLFFHIITTLQHCPDIEKIVIDTDSPVIMEMAAAHFPDVTLLERPAELRDGAIPMNNILLNVARQVPSRFYLQTHATNPLLTAKTINNALRQFTSGYPAHDSLFSVTEKHVRLWDAQSSPVNHDPRVLMRTQDLPPIFEENSCIYMYSGDSLSKNRNRIGERPVLFGMDALEAEDIDVEHNFRVAEILFKLRRQTQL